MAVKNRNSRYIYISVLKDLDIFNIILSNCKYKLLDKKEIELNIKSLSTKNKIKDNTVSDYIIRENLNNEVNAVLKEKKNRHVIYFCYDEKPLTILEKFKAKAKSLNSKNDFYYILITDDPKWLNHPDFYVVYVMEKDYHK